MPGVGFDMESLNAMAGSSNNTGSDDKKNNNNNKTSTTVAAVSPTSAASAGVEDGVKQHALRPLEELSEADIRQLTREDCRRYLKERGMRRPSWNKAQAIHQVLSLKGLLCSSSSSSAKASKATKESGRGGGAVTTGLLEVERRTATPPPPLVPRTKELLDKVGPSSNDNNNYDPRPPVTAFGAPQQSFLNPLPPDSGVKAAAHGSAPGGAHRAQLTIFYSGIVNVYDDVPLEKAQAIMLLASSKTFHVPNPLPSTTAIRPPLQAAQGEQPVPLPVNRGYVSPFLSPSPEPVGAAPASVNNAHEESTDSAGLPQARTVSLQRFLAKRRERISANPSYYSRRSEKQSSKRTKPSSSPPSPPPPPPQPPLQLVPPRTAGSPLRSTNTTHRAHKHSSSDFSSRSRSTASSDTSGRSATTTTTGGGGLDHSYFSMELLGFRHGSSQATT